MAEKPPQSKGPLTIEEIRELREILESRRAFQIVSGWFKAVALWITAIIGAYALFAKTVGMWVQQHIGIGQ